MFNRRKSFADMPFSDWERTRRRAALRSSLESVAGYASAWVLAWTAGVVVIIAALYLASVIVVALHKVPAIAVAAALVATVWLARSFIARRRERA